MTMTTDAVLCIVCLCVFVFVTEIWNRLVTDIVIYMGASRMGTVTTGWSWDGDKCCCPRAALE